nr:MAG TPA: hypothetical protein [Caudoviricetes sp.]
MFLNHDAKILSFILTAKYFIKFYPNFNLCLLI